MPFLATTALDEFWDPSQPLVFLGEWCCRYSRRASWENLGGTMMPSPWADSRGLAHARQEVNALYERILPEFAKGLETLHGVTHSARGWRIIAGPWLYHCISVLYDRYHGLEEALEKYPRLTTWLWLPEKTFIPTDGYDFYYVMVTDAYNLWLYSRILQAMGHDFPVRPYFPGEVGEHPALPGFRRRLKALARELSKSFRRLMGWRCRVLGHATYFPPRVDLRLMREMRGRYLTSFPEPKKYPERAVDRRAREALASSISTNGRFTEILKGLLPDLLPKVLVENFHDVRRVAEGCPTPAGGVLLSAEAWHYDEFFKHQAALHVDSGGKLAGIQHGGTYGVHAFVPHLNHELEITDRYYTWGWTAAGREAKITPFIASKWVGRPTIGASNRKDGILFVGTTEPRYLSLFQMAPCHMAEYFNGQQRFLAALPTEYHATLVARFVPEEFGWDYSARWRDNSPLSNIDDLARSFTARLEEVRLCVIDHFSTTWLEALSADKPTLLFGESAIADLDSQVGPFADLLREAGILYDTPEAVASAVTRIYPDVERWWTAPALQAARKKVCDHFARISPSAFQDWKAELGRLGSGQAC